MPYGTTEPLPRSRALILGAALVYLAVPNILFLAGWFTPPVAIAACTLIVAAVLYACLRLVRNAQAPGQPFSTRRTLLAWMAAVLLLAIAVLHFLSGGIVGVYPTCGDYLMFRQALFCNMRDAAWPVILPNGKEMSYYLANILPPALAARVLPAASGQWCIVLWAVLPFWLAMLLLISRGSRQATGNGWCLLFIPLAVFLIRDPLYICFHSIIGRYLQDVVLLCGADCSTLLCPHTRMPTVAGECVGAWNSTPATLLAAAVMYCGGKENRYLVPLTYSLLVACSPIACIGLLPLAILLYCRAWKGGRMGAGAVLRESPLPLLMLTLCLVYFRRAESSVIFSHPFTPFAWDDAFCGIVRVLAAWVLLVLPLARAKKNDAVFVVEALFLLLAHTVYIGSSDVKSNELWLKSAPAYLMILACCWVEAWDKLPKVKYAILALCMAGALHSGYKLLSHADAARYGQVEDVWNGHLNHAHPFLNQSVPTTKQPLVPGILLRGNGASEQHFPGNLLPHAPGCDYTRPAKL